MTALSPAARDVIAERQRQVEFEVGEPEHDDAHTEGQLAATAACYALLTTDRGREATYIHGRWRDILDQYWPWPRSWYQSTTPRRDLVKAGALILAEIERIDRAARTSTEGE